MQTSPTLEIARTYCEQGKPTEAASALSVTWDDLLDAMVDFDWSSKPADTSAAEALVLAICVRNFVDRSRGIGNRRTLTAMLGRIRAYLGDEPPESRYSQLRCVVLANLADDHRRTEEFRYAEELFENACAAVPADSPTGALAAMQHGLLCMDVGNYAKGEHYLVQAGKVIVSRDTAVPLPIHTLLSTLLLRICRNDFTVLYKVLGLRSNAEFPPTDMSLLTQLNAGMVSGNGIKEADFWPQCYVPLLAPIG